MLLPNLRKAYLAASHLRLEAKGEDTGEEEEQVEVKEEEKEEVCAAARYGKAPYLVGPFSVRHSANLKNFIGPLRRL